MSTTRRRMMINIGGQPQEVEAYFSSYTQPAVPSSSGLLTQITFPTEIKATGCLAFCGAYTGYSSSSSFPFGAVVAAGPIYVVSSMYKSNLTGSYSNVDDAMVVINPNQGVDHVIYITGNSYSFDFKSYIQGVATANNIIFKLTFPSNSTFAKTLAYPVTWYYIYW